MNTLSLEESVKLYAQAWNEEGLENIKAALEKCWTAESTYIDPQNPLTKGADELAALIQTSEDKMPGRKFRQLSEPDFHNHSGRFKWLLTRKDGTTREGFDYFEYNDNHQITRIVGFFGAI